MTNGGKYLDTDGNQIHAHGGWMLEHEGFVYWYGEDRRDNHYVAVYRSRDMRNWEFRGHIISDDTKVELANPEWNPRLTNVKDGKTCKVNIERPKVLFCKKTGKFVLWAHWENGCDYLDASACIATSDYPDRDFVYNGSFRPFGEMSRDCTLHVDAEGTAWFVSASNDNKDLHVYRLADDLMSATEWSKTLFKGEYREAPAIFVRDGRTYLLSSYCTGWNPNQGKWTVADSITGDWAELKNFGDETTYRSQPTFVWQSGNRYWYFADRWDPQDYFNSSYVVLEIEFDADGAPYIVWKDEMAVPPAVDKA